MLLLRKIYQTNIGPVLLLCLILSSVSFWAKKHHDLKTAFLSELSEVEVIIPENFPEITQESIDLAMVMFSIQSNPSTLAPVLNLDLQDRGLTTAASFSNETKVTIGPASFESWSILGSTLAHEVEIHANQSFFLIWLQDVLSLEGTKHAERVAYQHEISQSHRFGLDQEMTRSISDTMNHYYPITKGKKKKEGLSAYVRDLLGKKEF